MKNRKEYILQTALSLFKKHGFENVTVDSICKECNMTKGSFYHHFNSKHEILTKYFSILLPHHLSLMPDMLDEDNHLEQAWILLEYAIEYARIMGADLLKHFWVYELQNGGRILSPFSVYDDQDYLQLMTKIIVAGQESGDIRGGISPDRLITAYTSALMGISSNWSATGGAYDVKRTLRDIFETIFRP